jgi:hypothetical protein
MKLAGFIFYGSYFSVLVLVMLGMGAERARRWWWSERRRNRDLDQAIGKAIDVSPETQPNRLRRWRFPRSALRRR